ncbi:amidase [Solirubrobacter ginsenosidimutans]|uniref:Amidase n=1 Tax=Solirubrobacter ginsenosidimutans TaxID=490573 RepID=A0A9X3S501_9ACTN|nr:amidase [Solirubrobacter ginsenosidimutans]MDA0166364.1 amidase [Solirubrobacter ginsenosidimutans]
MAGVTRRRFIQTSAATGAAAALLPASRARGERTVPAPADVSARTRAYLEEQRKAGVRAGGDLAFLTGTQLAAMLAARDVSSREVTQAFLARINALNGDGGFSVPSRPVTGTTPNPDIPVYGNNGKLNAYVRVYDDLALSMAKEADARLDAGGAPLGCGVPIAIKDIFAVGGHELTLGCPLMKGNVATGDSTVAARARAAGMPILGQTHTGPWTSDDTCPQTANPWKRSKAVGGSSGGSAAAVASRLAVLSVGSDTGNSVRNPACNTGVGTIKPTYGLIPLYGATPLTVSNDHAGPICRAMTDVSLLLGVLAGPDPLDPRSLQAPPAPAYYPLAPTPGDLPLAGVRIGSTIETETSPARASWAPGILARLRAAVEQFRALGATIVDVAPATSNLGSTAYFKAAAPDPFTGAAVSASGVYGNAENAYVLRDTYTQTADPLLVGAVKTRFRRTAAISGVEGKDQLLQRAAKFTPEDLFGAYQVRREYCEAWAKVFADNDLHACLWPQKVQTPPDRADDFTGSFSGVESSRPNTTGWPCVDVPVGRDASTGIPVGIDIAAPLGADATVLQIAIDYQAHFPYHLDVPTDL